MFDKECGGGSILHINMQDKVTPRQVKKLIHCTVSNGVVYFAINYNFSKCTKCGKVYIGKMEESPCCHAIVRKFLRVVGFLTEVSNWSKGRREEYPNRQFYKDDSLETMPAPKKIS